MLYETKKMLKLESVQNCSFTSYNKRLNIYLGISSSKQLNFFVMNLSATLEVTHLNIPVKYNLKNQLK